CPAGRGRMVYLCSPDDRADDALDGPAHTMLRLLRDSRDVEVLVVHDGSPKAAALSALLKSIRRERPGLKWKTVAIDDWSTGVAVIAAEIGELDDSEIRYVAGARSARAIEEMTAPADPFAWRQGGVYLITGGGGGLGQAIASFLTRELDARVIVC